MENCIEDVSLHPTDQGFQSLGCDSELVNHEDCGLFQLPHNPTYPLCLQFKKFRSCQFYMSVSYPGNRTSGK